MATTQYFKLYNPINFIPACQNTYNNQHGEQQFTTSLSISASIWLSIFFIQNVALVTIMYLIRNIQQTFSIVKQLFWLTVCWIISNTTGIIMSIFASSYQQGIIIFDLILVISLTIIFYFSVIQPIRKTKTDLTIPFAEPSDIVHDFPHVLYRPTPARYFYRYLQKNFPENLCYFELLNEIIYFDYLMGEDSFEAARHHAIQIMHKYLNDQSDSYCQFQDEVIDQLQDIFKESNFNQVQENIFDPIQVRSQEKLLEAWNQFAESRKFTQLINELKEQELFYSGMRRATMISNEKDSSY